MRTPRVVASVVLGLALGAPAAQASTPASICDPVGSRSFFSDSVTAAGGAAGRGTVREPDHGQVHDSPLARLASDHLPLRAVIDLAALPLTALVAA